MTRSKKANKFNPRKAIKYFTAATVAAVAETLGEIAVEDLINSIYIKTYDNDVNYFIKQYEKQLILSKINNEKFEKGLHQFYFDMADYIKSNGLYKKFFELSYLSYIVFSSKVVKPKILTAYQDLLIQQFPYLSGTTKKVPYGVDSRGRLLTVAEIGPNLTEINYEIHMLVRSKKASNLDYENTIVKMFRKYGYKANTVRDCHEQIVRDQMITNMHYFLSNFINEDTKDIISKPHRNPMDLVKPNPIFLRNNHVATIKDKLIQRSILLPSEGITAKFNNCDEVKELYLKEVIEEATVVLLFRVKFSDGSFTSGYYNTKDEVFYDMWKESSHAEVTHIPLENIVLQNYLNLTCNLCKEEKESLFWFAEVKHISKLSNMSFAEPTVYYEIKEHYVGSRNGVITKNFDRAKYIAELMNIQPFIRKLPIGATASKEAIEIAKKLGIELPIGKTLVRGFVKKVYKNE